jgi:hypothetical protein
MFKDARIEFNIVYSISTNFKIFKYFSASTSANYNEVWTAKNLRKTLHTDQSAVVDKVINGFDAYRTYFLQA